MQIQDIINNVNFYSFGEKILFLPVVIVIFLVIVGLLLFVITNVVYGFSKIPKTLVEYTVAKEIDAEEEFKKKIKIDTKLSQEDLIVGLKSGSWLIWVAILPLMLCILFGMLYLVSITPILF